MEKWGMCGKKILSVPRKHKTVGHKCKATILILIFNSILIIRCYFP